MPVLNTKTGEMDYVDISLVDKILIDSKSVRNFVSEKNLKIDFKLSAGDGDVVILEASTPRHNEKKNIELSDFETYLFKAINEVKSQKLEEVVEFNSITEELLQQIVKLNELEYNYYVQLDKKIERNNGLGIITDSKTGQDVGTFEYIDYMFRGSIREIKIHGILLSGRSFDDLKEESRYVFSYYSLDEGIIYSIESGTKSRDRFAKSEQSTYYFKNFDAKLEVFPDDHKYFAMINEAQEKKSLLADIDENHPLYDRTYSEFRENRLSILEASKTKQKKEKLVSQFADIDI